MLRPYDEVVDNSDLLKDPDLARFADAFRVQCIADNEALNVLLAKNGKRKWMRLLRK